MTDEQKAKAKAESKKILAKYKVNEQVASGYLQDD